MATDMMTAPDLDARVRGGHSLHEIEQRELCPSGLHAHWRVVKCDGCTDVIECSRCGAQKEVPCDFDEEYD